jgi:hypothetical protein
MKCFNAFSIIAEVFVVFVVGRFFSRFLFVGIVLFGIAFDFFFDFSFLEIIFLSNDINLAGASASILLLRCRGKPSPSYLSVVMD